MRRQVVPQENLFPLPPPENWEDTHEEELLEVVAIEPPTLGGGVDGSFGTPLPPRLVQVLGLGEN